MKLEYEDWTFEKKPYKLARVVMSHMHKRIAHVFCAPFSVYMNSSDYFEKLVME